MGNCFYPTKESVNHTHIIIETLKALSIQIKDENIFNLDNITKNKIKLMYRNFYYPTHSQTRLNESDFQLYISYHLRRKLSNHIFLYNKYNSFNIDVDDYVDSTLDILKISLPLILISKEWDMTHIEFLKRRRMR
jgi:hypothetical protein